MDFKWIPITMIGLALLVVLYYVEMPVPVIVKFILAIAVLFITGRFFTDYYRLDGQYGLILFKTKKGLEWVDSTAKKYKKLWIYMADTGIVWGFGIVGIYILYKNIMEQNKKIGLEKVIIPIVSGSILLALTILFISPTVFPIATSVISNINLSKTADSVNEIPLDPYMVVLFISLALFGIVGYTIASLIVFAVIVVYNFLMIILGYSVEPVEPGGTLLLPGINLPLVEGIISLIVLLFVHEVSHGLLARIANVRLDSGGIVLFGFIPIGAFIEPDEKKLKKKSRLEKTRVMVAGSTANLFTMFIFFIILVSFLHFTEDYRDINIFVTQGNLPEGAEILYINNISISQNNINDIQLKPNQQVVIVTDKGTFKRTTDENGKIGFYYTIIDPLDYDSFWLKFAYNTLALIFMLNFFVGLINLIPIPGLDGYHILDANVKNKLLVKLIMYIMLACFLAVFLPWIYK